MSLETPTWDKITGPLSSTTNEFGGNWGNLISDYYNGTNIGLIDATKIPIIGTLTRYKFEKLGIFDIDQSHHIVFSADDIDTGPTRKIRFRRMNTPFEEDFAVLEQMGQTIINKTINADSNTITNIENADIKAAAGIVYSKLSLSNSILNADINSSAAIGWTKISKSGSVLSDIADTSLASLAQYDLIMRNGSSQWAKLTKGSNSTALTVDASGVVSYTTITNAMLAGSIAYSKLSLSNSILNADINSSAAIVTSKLADSANFHLKTIDNSFGAHYFDITNMTAPVNPTTGDARFFKEVIDSNNDGLFVHIKKNGSFQKVQIV